MLCVMCSDLSLECRSVVTASESLQMLCVMCSDLSVESHSVVTESTRDMMCSS